jgi:hypothetical protein
MGMGIKNKMEQFFESISDREKSHNKKLNAQISFLKKYLGCLGDLNVGSSEDELIQKYFHIQLRNELGQMR